MITLEKSYKINFLWKKNEDQINAFKVTKKASSPLKKMFSKKKNSFQLICVNMIFKKVCGNFLKKNGSRDI